MFIGSIISYDGYIHGNTFILTRNLLTIKGVILDSLLTAIEKIRPMDLLLVNGRKYLQGISLLVSKKLSKNIANEIDHVRKKELAIEILRKTREIEFQKFINYIRDLENYIENARIVSWRDKKYPNSHGYRLIFYTRDVSYADLVANIMRVVGIKVQTLKKSRIVKISSHKPQLSALALLMGKTDLEAMIPNYKRSTFLWNYLIELYDSLNILKESLIEKGLWHETYRQRFHNIIYKLGNFLKRIHDTDI